MSAPTYEENNLVTFLLHAPWQAQADVLISSQSGFYLPLSFDNLHQPSFSAILVADTYDIEVNFTYYDYLFGYEETFSLPLPEEFAIGEDDPPSPPDQVQSYTVTLEILDEESEAISSAKIIFTDEENDTITAHTSDDGIVEKSLEEGEYELIITAATFEGRNKTITVDKDEHFSITLSKYEDEDEAVDEDEQPGEQDYGIEVLKPKQTEHYPDIAIPLSFTIEDYDLLERCQILLRTPDNSGFSIVETILSPQAEHTLTLSSALPGNHRLKIRCIGDNDDYQITEELLFSIYPLQQLETDITAWKNTLENAINELDDLSPALQTISFLQILAEKTSKQYDLLYQHQTELQENVTSTNFESIQQKITDIVVELESSALVNLSTNSLTSTVIYLSNEEVEQLYQTLLVQELYSQVKELSAKQLYQLQEQFAIRTSYTSLRLDYADGKDNSYTYATIDIVPITQETTTDYATSLDYFALIPSSLANRLVSDEACTQTDSYCVFPLSFNDSLSAILVFSSSSMEEMNIKTLALPKKHSVDEITTNLITGKVVGDQDFDQPSWHIPVVSLLALTLVLGLILNPYFSVLSLMEKRKVTRFTTTAHDCLDAVTAQRYDSALILFPQVFQLYDNLPKFRKEEAKTLLNQLSPVFQECVFQKQFHVLQNLFLSQPYQLLERPQEIQMLQQAFEQLDNDCQQRYGVAYKSLIDNIQVRLAQMASAEGTKSI